MAEETFYQPINSEENYNSENLIQHYEDFQDMQKYLQTIQQDSENTGAWEDAGGLLRKNPNYYFQTKRTPRSDLEKALSEEYDNLGKYAKNNSEILYGKLESEDYEELIQKVQLYKTDNNEHNEFVDAMNEIKKLTEVSKDQNKIHDYVKEKISKAPKWVQISFERHSENDLSAQFQSYFMHAQMKLQSKMYDENQQLKTGFLEKVFKDSLAEVESELSKEDYSESERNDVWEANLRPYYFTLFEGAYKKEKEDEDKPQEKKDRNERRKIRREKGMAF